MSDTVVFLDANALASPVTRTLVIARGSRRRRPAERALPRSDLRALRGEARLDTDESRRFGICAEHLPLPTSR